MARPKGTKNKAKKEPSSAVKLADKLIHDQTGVHILVQEIPEEILKNGFIGEVAGITTASPEPKEEITNVNNCEYHLTMNFNGEKFECFTNNLEVGILSFKPTIVLTEGYVKIQKGETVFERRYPLIRMKQFFNDPETLQIFLANLQLG